MYQNFQFTKRQLEQLEGWWYDSCPFEFTNEKFKNQQELDMDGQKLKITNSGLCAEFTLKKSVIIIEVSTYPKGQLLYTARNMRPNLEWDYNTLVFDKTSLGILTLCQQGLFYYHNKKSGNFKVTISYKILHYAFIKDELFVVEKYLRGTCNNFVWIMQVKNSKTERIQHQLRENYEYTFLKQPRHRLGFFKMGNESITLFLNPQAKKICYFKKNGFSKDKFQETDNLYYQDCYVKDDFLFINQDSHSKTLMTQMRNGRSIRRIQHDNGKGTKLTSKQIYKHLLIVCFALTENNTNQCDLYDLRSGNQVASIKYQTNLDLQPVTIINDQLVLPNYRAYQLKKQFLYK